jgi:small subunit ribosomal protein S16
MGKIRAPFYRVVVMDSRTKRDGRAIEEIGKYHPTEEPSVIDINSERAQYWLGQGAQPTEAVAALLKITGDWQKYKGEPGTEGTLKVKESKPSKKELYEAAIAAAGKADTAKDTATTPKKKAEKKADEAKADQPKAEKKADEPKAEKKADEPKAAEPKAEEAAPAADTDSGAAAAASTDADADATKAATLVDAPADGGFGPDSAPATEDGSAPEGFAIKGNKDSMKYHEPDGQWYEQTVAEVWFKSAEAAEAAGFVKAGA